MKWVGHFFLPKDFSFSGCFFRYNFLGDYLQLPPCLTSSSETSREAFERNVCLSLYYFSLTGVFYNLFEFSLKSSLLYPLILRLRVVLPKDGGLNELGFSFRFAISSFTNAFDLSIILLILSICFLFTSISSLCLLRYFSFTWSVFVFFSSMWLLDSFKTSCFAIILPGGSWVEFRLMWHYWGWGQLIFLGDSES